MTPEQKEAVKALAQAIDLFLVCTQRLSANLPPSLPSPKLKTGFALTGCFAMGRSYVDGAKAPFSTY